MSLLFADSFDGVIAGATKWDVFDDGATIDAAYGRNGTKGLLTSNATNWDMVKFLSPGSNRVIAGMWLYNHDNISSPASQRVLGFNSNTGSSITVRFNVPRLWVEGTGVTGQSIGSPGHGQGLTWLFIELMWEPGVAYEVRVNTETIASGSAGGSGTPSEFLFFSGSSGSRPRFRIEDVYILDSTGSVNNDFLGPIKIANLKPDGAGDRTELTANPAGNNWERVSDGSDATYVEGGSGDGDLYTFDDLSSSDDVLGVVQYWRAFDSEGGGITGRAISQVGGTEYDGDAKIMPGSVATHVQPWDVNPDTSQPWTPAEVDGAEFGVEFA